VRHLAPTRVDLVDAGFLAAMCVLALVGFRTTYDGWTFLLIGVAGLLLGILVGHLANALRQPMITVAVLTVAVFFLLGGTVVLRQLPTASTLRGLADVGVNGWKQLLTTLPPVDGSGPLLAIPYILGLLCGSGGFTLARRVSRSAAPVFGPAAVLAAVILLGTGQPAAQLLQGVVFGCLALCWSAVRGARVRLAARNGSGRVARLVTGATLLAVASATAAIAGPLVAGGHDRMVLRSYIAPPVDLGEYPSPLVGFRKYTKDANQLWDQTLFTVSGLPQGSAIRIATLDDYTGSVWAATNGARTDGARTEGVQHNSFQRVGSRIYQSGNGQEVTLHVTIGPAYAASDDINAWLPTAGRMTGIEFAGDRGPRNVNGFRYNLGTSSGVVRDRLGAGDAYTVRTVLDTAAAIPEDAQPFGRPWLSESASSFVGSRAAKWAGDVVGTGARLRAVAAYLRDNGAYSSGGPGETEYLPGHSLGRLTAFLNAKRPVGDDEQYAAAFALIANNLGMPARVVLGAVPAADGTVRGQDVHPWVEIHLADGSWAPIPHTEFMPDTSKKPDQQPPQQVENTAAAVVPPPNTVRSPDSLTDSSQVDGSGQPSVAPPPRRWQLPGWAVAALTWGGPPLLVVLLVASTLVGLKARRRRNRRTRGTPVNRFAAGWREIVDHARDLGAVVPPGQTRREEAVTLAALPVGHLAAAADATVFGPGDPPPQAAAEYWVAVDSARRQLSRGVGRWRRLRAAVSVRSLRRPRPVRTAT